MVINGQLTPIDRVAGVLAAIGGINWGLVGLFKFDVVAAIFGKDFGETTTVTRIIYTVVGVAAVWVLARALSPRER